MATQLSPQGSSRSSCGMHGARWCRRRLHCPRRHGCTAPPRRCTLPRALPCAEEKMTWQWLMQSFIQRAAITVSSFPSTIICTLWRCAQRHSLLSPPHSWGAPHRSTPDCCALSKQSLQQCQTDGVAPRQLLHQGEEASFCHPPQLSFLTACSAAPRWLLRLEQAMPGGYHGQLHRTSCML